MPRSRSASHAAGRRRSAAARRRPRPAPPGVASSNTNPVPRPAARRVDDRVREAARPPDDRRRAVAQGDHLALAARLEPRRHQEHVRAGVDPPGHIAVEALDQRDPAGLRGRERPQRVGERRVAAALDDEPGAAGEQRRRAVGQEVEALLRIQPADHPSTGRGRPPGRARRARAGPRRHAALPAGSAREYGAASARRSPGPRGPVSSPLRIPRNRSPLRAQRAVEAHAELRRQRLAREPGLDGVDEVRRSIAVTQQVDAVGFGARRAATRGRRPELPSRSRRVQPW